MACFDRRDGRTSPQQPPMFDELDCAVVGGNPRVFRDGSDTQRFAEIVVPEAVARLLNRIATEVSGGRTQRIDVGLLVVANVSEI